MGGIQESGWWSAWVSHPPRGAPERPDGQLVHRLGSMEPSFWNKVVSVAFNTAGRDVMLGGGGAGLIAGFMRECDSVAKTLRSGAGTGQDTKGSSSSLMVVPQPCVPSSRIFVPKAVPVFITSPLGMSPQPCLRFLTHNNTHLGTGVLTLRLTTHMNTHTRLARGQNF